MTVPKKIRIAKWHGKPVANPGIFSGIPIDRYHAADICVEPSISSTGLRTIFQKSPAHYWCNSPYNPARIEKEPSEALVLGLATHHLLLGEKRFNEKFARRPDMMGGVRWSGRGACQLWLADRAREGRTVITTAMLQQIRGMAESLKLEPLVRAGILNGDIEVSLIWKDPETGIWLKARPDALPNDSLDFADLKTTSSVFEDDLRRSIHDFGYYQQAALIAEGCYQCTGMKMNSFSLVFVESKPPHCVAILTMRDVDIDRGHRANRIALKTFANCMKTQKWPGPWGDQLDARYIAMLPFNEKKLDERLKTP